MVLPRTQTVVHCTALVLTVVPCPSTGAPRASHPLSATCGSLRCTHESQWLPCQGEIRNTSAKVIFFYLLISCPVSALPPQVGGCPVPGGSGHAQWSSWGVWACSVESCGGLVEFLGGLGMLSGVPGGLGMLSGDPTLPDIKGDALQDIKPVEVCRAVASSIFSHTTLLCCTHHHTHSIIALQSSPQQSGQKGGQRGRG